MRYAVLAAIILGAVATAAAADPRDQVMDSAARCTTIADSRTWLTCFYDAAQPMRAYLSLSPPGQATPLQTMPTVESAPVAQSGLWEGMFGSNDAVVKNVKMVEYSFDSNGAFTVTLANGEVWRQVPDHTKLAHWTKPAASYVVTVTPGAMSTYNFGVEGVIGFYKATRIR